MEIPPADICTSTSCKNVSACCRGKSNIPSHLRHDCLHCRSIRTNALLESDLAHSTDKRVSERDHGGRTPKRFQMGCNPREPCPKHARSNRAPSASSASFYQLIRKGGSPFSS